MTAGFETAPPSLYEWAPPRGREPAPPPVEPAVAAFAQAGDAYGRGEYAEAAEGFVAAALLVPASPGGPYAVSLGRMRETAYRNAALSWSAQATPDAGRRALSAAAERDAPHAALLRELAAAL